MGPADTGGDLDAGMSPNAPPESPFPGRRVFFDDGATSQAGAMSELYVDEEGRVHLVARAMGQSGEPAEVVLYGLRGRDGAWSVVAPDMRDAPSGAEIRGLSVERRREALPAEASPQVAIRALFFEAPGNTTIFEWSRADDQAVLDGTDYRDLTPGNQQDDFTQHLVDEIPYQQLFSTGGGRTLHLLRERVEADERLHFLVRPDADTNYHHLLLYRDVSARTVLAQTARYRDDGERLAFLRYNIRDEGEKHNLRLIRISVDRLVDQAPGQESLLGGRLGSLEDPFIVRTRSQAIAGIGLYVDDEYVLVGHHTPGTGTLEIEQLTHDNISVGYELPLDDSGAARDVGGSVALQRDGSGRPVACYIADASQRLVEERVVCQRRQASGAWEEIFASHDTYDVDIGANSLDAVIGPDGALHIVYAVGRPDNGGELVYHRVE
jgi:hypothetical protein